MNLEFCRGVFLISAWNAKYCCLNDGNECTRLRIITSLKLIDYMRNNACFWTIFLDCLSLCSFEKFTNVCITFRSGYKHRYMAQLVFVRNRAKNSTGGKKAFLHLSKKTVSSHLDNTKMPKFKRVCNNPFHKDWSKTDGDKIVNVKACGLMAVANALERYVEAELGKKGWHTINNLCTACLKACTSKRKVTKFFRRGDLEVLKNTIQSQV